jgi:hypothetical protein
VDRSRRSTLVAVAAAACGVACSFTGLGNYDVPTCKNPLGNTEGTQQIGQIVGTPQLSFTAGGSPVAAYFVLGTGCAQLATNTGPVGMGTCLLDAAQSPQQPYGASIGTGFVAAGVATTAPCQQGVVMVVPYADSAVGTPAFSSCRPNGAALPSVAALADATDAWVAWYETPASTRSSPMDMCQGAQAAPLRLALASGANTGSPSLNAPVTLTSGSISVRPPAMALSGSTVVLASPDGEAVSLWTLDGTSAPSSPTSVSALAGARAVAVATDGGTNIAVVAEIGCQPQSIALSLGTVSGGFGAAITVAPMGSGFQVLPTVAWVPAEGYWIVSWLSSSGGTHALARRYDAQGNPVGDVLDPNASLFASTVTSSGALFGFEQSSSGTANIESVGLGCALGPGGSESAQ